MSKIAVAINEVYKRIGYVQKDGNVNFGNTKYNYAGEAAFIKAIRPVMTEFGLSIAPINMEILSNQNGLVNISAIYRLLHTSGESLDIFSLGQGKDSADKAIPKALTGAYKYALRQTFMIETGDDPDNVGSEVYEEIERIYAAIFNSKDAESLNHLINHQATKKALDGIKKASYTDYARLLQAVKEKQKTFITCKDVKEDVVESKVSKISKQDTSNYDRLLEKVESFKAGEVGELLSKSQDWIKKNCDDQQRYKIFKTLLSRITNDNTTDEKLDIVAIAIESCIYSNDLEFVTTELGVLYDVIGEQYKDSIEKKISGLEGLLPYKEM